MNESELKSKVDQMRDVINQHSKTLKEMAKIINRLNIEVHKLSNRKMENDHVENLTDMLFNKRRPR